MYRTFEAGQKLGGGLKINETRTLIPEQCNFVHEYELIISALITFLNIDIEWEQTLEN